MKEVVLLKVLILILMSFVFCSVYASENESYDSDYRSCNVVVSEEKTPCEEVVVYAEKEENSPKFVVNDEERELLARVVYTEARGESFEVKKKIASVVLNRVESPHFPKSVKEVVYQKDQFLVDEDIPVDTPIDVAYPYPTDEECRRAVNEVSRSGSVLPREVLVFYASYSSDEWLNSRPTYEQVDSTVFAYLR